MEPLALGGRAMSGAAVLHLRVEGIVQEVGFRPFVSTIARRNDLSRWVARVVLSGGVFQNPTILQQALGRLEARGFAACRDRKVPPIDGGIALGQTAIAAARMRQER